MTARIGGEKGGGPEQEKPVRLWSIFGVLALALPMITIMMVMNRRKGGGPEEEKPWCLGIIFVKKPPHFDHDKALNHIEGWLIKISTLLITMMVMNRRKGTMRQWAH